tara:strand:+ start:127 stop:504 length:378 start_codon:yes stop_codon:yes gene_type:complete
MKHLLPITTKEWLVLLAVLLSCAQIVFWLWSDLILAVTYWQLTLAIVCAGLFLVWGSVKRPARLGAQIKTLLEQAKDGLSREELLTALCLTETAKLDEALTLLLTYEEVEWREQNHKMVLSLRHR